MTATTKKQIETIISFAEEKLGLRVTLCRYKKQIVNRQKELDDVGYAPGHIYFLQSAFVGWLVHEVAHWLVATPHERTLSNYGFDRPSFYRAILRETQAADGTVMLWRFLFPKEAQVLGKIRMELGAHPSPCNQVKFELLIAKAIRRNERAKKEETRRKAQELLDVPVEERTTTTTGGEHEHEDLQAAGVG